jgi:hypothetical protein
VEHRAKDVLPGYGQAVQPRPKDTALRLPYLFGWESLSERAATGTEAAMVEGRPGKETSYFLTGGLFFHRALAAFFARSDRCSGVMLSATMRAPFFPPRFPCLRKYSRTSGGSIFFGISIKLNPVCIGSVLCIV